MQLTFARHCCEVLMALHTSASLALRSGVVENRACLKMHLPKMPGSAPATSAPFDDLNLSQYDSISSSSITTSSCIVDYTALPALHSSLTSTANTATPPASQTPCAIKTGTSFCIPRTAKCLLRSSKPPATPCRRAVLPMAMVCPPHPRPG